MRGGGGWWIGGRLTRRALFGGLGWWMGRAGPAAGCGARLLGGEDRRLRCAAAAAAAALCVPVVWMGWVLGACGCLKGRGSGGRWRATDSVVCILHLCVCVCVFAVAVYSNPQDLAKPPTAGWKKVDLGADPCPKLVWL